MAQIIIMTGPCPGKTYDIEGPLTIGNSDRYDIQLKGRNIGKSQRIVIAREGHYCFIQSHRYNGVQINGTPIKKERKLVHGDMITVDSVMLLYGEEEDKVEFIL